MCCGQPAYDSEGGRQRARERFEGWLFTIAVVAMERRGAVRVLRVVNPLVLGLAARMQPASRGKHVLPAEEQPPHARPAVAIAA